MIANAPANIGLHLDDIEKSHIEEIWKPFKKEDCSEYMYPSNGYLGSVIVPIVENSIFTIGFHAWEQNDSEFVYYKIIE